jgi:hypothetical protein
LQALDLEPAACEKFAERLTWEACARMFLEHVTEGARASREKRMRKDRLKALFANVRARRTNKAAA